MTAPSLVYSVSLDPQRRRWFWCLARSALARPTLARLTARGWADSKAEAEAAAHTAASGPVPFRNGLASSIMAGEAYQAERTAEVDAAWQAGAEGRDVRNAKAKAAPRAQRRESQEQTDDFACHGVGHDREAGAFPWFWAVWRGGEPSTIKDVVAYGWATDFMHALALGHAAARAQATTFADILRRDGVGVLSMPAVERRMRSQAYRHFRQHRTARHCTEAPAETEEQVAARNRAWGKVFGFEVPGAAGSAALEALGLGPEADEAAVQKAYRLRARTLHPDAAGGGDVVAFREITAHRDRALEAVRARAACQEEAAT